MTLRIETQAYSEKDHKMVHDPDVGLYFSTDSNHSFTRLSVIGSDGKEHVVWINKEELKEAATALWRVG